MRTRILLVNPPSVNRDLSEVAPPLGLYSLATVAKNCGIDVHVWDGNIEAISRADSRFYADFDRICDDFRPTHLGVTSMVVNTHVALNVARRAKDHDASIVTIVGGPHFSAFADEAAKRFSFVDHVIKGEGEAAFGRLLQVSTSQRLPGVLNEPVSAASLCSIRPAFADVPWKKYFKRNPRKTANYESSRGCIYQCAFCYSPKQWGGRPRYVADDIVVTDLRALERQGVRHVFFVDDNFLNDRGRALRLCERLISERINLRWLCYATLNRLDVSSIAGLASAGCDAVFVGVDAVASDAQRELRKRFFRGRADALLRLRQCLDAGITPTCALIARRDADESELDDLLAFAAELRELGCAVRINPLIGYQGTPFAPRAESAWYTESRVRLMLDDSPLLRENTFAATEPHLFPYHCSTRNLTEDDAHLREVHAATTLVRHFPKTLCKLSRGGVGVWSRIREIAAGLGKSQGAHLRRLERKFAMTRVFQALPSDDATIAASEYATSLLPARRNWIRCGVVGHTTQTVDVRPFVLDETGAAPYLLVAAFDKSVQIFHLNQKSNRRELLRIATALRRRSSLTGRIVHMGKRTFTALQSAGLMKLSSRHTR